MVNTGRANRGILYILLIALRRVSGAILLALSLVLSTWALGVEFDQPYFGLLIVAVLLALMLSVGGVCSSQSFYC
jgi:hypothetical protein